MPSIAHASYTSLAYQRMIQLHEHRQFKGDSSLMDTQPLYVLMGSILIAGKGNIVVVLSLSLHQEEANFSYHRPPKKEPECQFCLILRLIPSVFVRSNCALDS
ncbi:hypothetical protein T06_416 [Trichinella sp. T6]|nr:hypothetical protein T06_416 [Trichinella sp. T6]